MNEVHLGLLSTSDIRITMISNNTSKNNRLILAKRPEKGPVTPETFKLETVDLELVQDGQVRVKVEYSAIEATMRNWLNEARSYIEPVKLGAVMRAIGVGRVVESKSDELKAGDLVYGLLGWQEYWQGSAKEVKKRDTPPGGRDFDHIGLLGSSGMTAYVGMFDIGQLKDGDVVVVSAAAGSVGLIAVQIALAHPKCKVIAIAGSDDKCQMLKDMGCHVALNYKSEDFKQKFKDIGLIDVYFDNVGGEILDMVLGRLNPHARIIACGAVSAYSAKTPYGLVNYTSLISMKAKIQGFIVMEHAHRFAEAGAYLAKLAKEGKMKYDYTILEPKDGEQNGLSRCVEGMELVSSGNNVGKTVIHMSRSDRKASL
ncbi:hypothetical protein BD324DRAFT_612273 [Kockovaella imperatae]|uniref:Enoyl reductase (ER) domain-containing protein n=1 Tax=Kockovaella imperatae TaxID=4999 RepID=A0A1Y1UTJ4_9TREE|nr:hypothetical protein BD324DRAFT_612273 [Kockovaella imperatae]ORX40844.1 hypothetical protein BD324DRAFT_612273 [Kockovaella imperatae]